jgi:hypothetical protein
LSFLDEREEAPRRSYSRRGPPRGPGTDQQTLLVRRAVAIGGGLLILVLLVLGVRGCLDARKESAFKEYMESVTALLQESNQQSNDFFDLLREPGSQGAVDLTNAVNASRSQAEQLVDRAEGEDHPDELNEAQGFLVETLEFRADGIRGIAEQLRTALGDRGSEQAIERIAAQMRNFDASDVIYSQRFVPAAQEALKDEGLLDEVTVPKSQFLPDIAWLRPQTVSNRLAGVAGGGGAVAPGLHGTGLGTVTVQPGGTQLQPGAATEVKAGSETSFDVQVANQGENDERDVTVKLSITGAGKPITVEEKLDTIAQGETKTVSIPLAAQPATGRPATVKVEIAAVPGEKKTDNNRGTFRVVFSR